MPELLKTCSSCKYESDPIESASCFECLTEDGQEQFMTNWMPKRGVKRNVATDDHTIDDNLGRHTGANEIQRTMP